MATLPSASTTLDDAAGSFGSGTQVIAVVAPVPGVVTAACDYFGGAAALLEEHDYCQGVDYSASHFSETGLPLVFVACPVGTAGSITHVDKSGNTGTSVCTVAAGSDGVLDQVHGIVEVDENGGGTIGTDAIRLRISMDGGFNWKTVRLGTASTYTIPYLGLVLSFTTGTLVAGDTILTFRSRGPRLDATGIAAAKTALAARNFSCRTGLVIGDLDTESECEAVRTAVQAYETDDKRFIKVRAQVRDRYRDAESMGFRGKTVGASLTFAEVGGTGDTITRATGSWIDDGFTVGDTVVVTGAVASSGANNVTGVIATLTATVITFGTTDLVAEGPITSATVKAYSTFTFAEVGSTADTITRSSGSFVTDGFKAGMALDVDGTASNDFTGATIVTATATVITLDTQDLAAEVIGGQLATLTASESKSAWKTDIADEFDAFAGDESRRLDLGAGYSPKLSTITGWRLRRPASWYASLREYKHDIHIPCWRVADGPLGGATLEDADDVTIEHDERVDGGLIAAGFTCLRTWNNEDGVFVAISLTRADEGSLLSLSHNLDVANAVCTTVQAATQREVGGVLELQRNGKATEASLALLESRINSQVARTIGDFGEGPRASSAVWSASRDDVLNVPDATLNGTLELELNGTIVHIATTVKVPVGAAAAA